jgi:CheY-like chemotaxis protein
MNRSTKELLALSFLPTAVLICYAAVLLFLDGTLSIPTIALVTITFCISCSPAARFYYLLINPFNKLIGQLDNDSNATIATGPIADLSIAIDAYVSHLEVEFQERVNQAQSEKKRLASLLAIVEQESVDKGQAARQMSNEIEREQTYLRHINYLSTTPLRAIIGLTNRIAVDPNNEDVLEELAMFAEQLRFLLDETSTTEASYSKQVIEPRTEIDEILTIVYPLCLQSGIEIYPFFSNAVPNAVYTADETFRSLVFNYILHYLTYQPEKPMQSLRLNVDYVGESLTVVMDNYPEESPGTRFSNLLTDTTQHGRLDIPAKKHDQIEDLPAQGITAVIVSDDEILRESLTARLQRLGMTITSDFKSPMLEVCFVSDETSDTFRIVQHYLEPNVMLFLLKNKTLYNVPNWLPLKHPIHQPELIHNLQNLDGFRPDKGAAINILAVDDSKPNLQLLVLQLEELGHQVSTANNGLQALELCHSHEFDLVFMDLQMPELGGIDAAREIRKMRNHHPRIIGLTAHISMDEQEECLAAGMEEVIVKPVRINTIRNITKRLPSTAKPK